MSDKRYFYGKGKRKTSTAKVRLYEKGSGDITVNGKKLNEYIPISVLQQSVVAPLKLTGNDKKFDISVLTAGGGVRGQSDAIRHGIARALVVYNEDLRSSLKKEGYLTRDPRRKERKKPGLKGARRASQFSKR